MRDIRQTRDLGIDPRLLSIRRVIRKPVTAQFYRQPVGGGQSTIRGVASEALACTVTGRMDGYGLRGSREAERFTDAGAAARTTWRFEVPFPTDSNGVAVDIARGDRVAVRGSDYRCVDVIDWPGFVECALERWT